MQVLKTNLLLATEVKKRHALAEQDLHIIIWQNRKFKKKLKKPEAEGEGEDAGCYHVVVNEVIKNTLISVYVSPCMC